MSTKPNEETVGEGHETKIADVRSIVLIGLGLLVVFLVFQVTVWMTMRHLRLGRSAQDQGSVATLESKAPSSGPRSATQIRDSRESTTYGWINREAGTVRIPIERAMQLVAERGLPDVGQNQTPQGLKRARPGATPAPKKRRLRY